MSKEGLQQRAAGGDLGGTMRLGAYPAKLNGNSVVHSIYGSDEISERHRHRYEVNIHYKDKLEKHGPALLGHVSRRPAARDRRAAGPSLVCGCAISPRVEEPSFRASPTLRELYRGGASNSRGWSDLSTGTPDVGHPLRGRIDHSEDSAMLLTIAIILLILWALGFFAFHVAGGLIHLLLVIGVIILIWNFVVGRRAV